MADTRTDSRRIAPRLARGLAGLLALVALLTLACESDEEPVAPSPVATATATPAPAATVAPRETPTVTATPTEKATATATAAPSATATPAATATTAPRETPTVTATPTEKATAIATAAPSATATPAATATAVPRETTTVTATPTEKATAIATAAPSATATPAAAATPSVTVSGPLIIVITDRYEREEDEWVSRRLVYVYDTSTDRYWFAFDYEHTRFDFSEHAAAVAVAGTGLIAWDEEQVRRVGLNGLPEATLFADQTVRGVAVSPDGAKVAIVYGDRYEGPHGLVVLNVATGDELLRVTGRDRRLQGLFEATGTVRFGLGRWSASSDSLSIFFRFHYGEWPYFPNPRFAILTLAGDVRVLPEGWLLSPDFRHAIPPGEVVLPRGYDEEIPPNGAYLQRGFDVIETGTGEVVWTVNVADGQGIIPYRWWERSSDHAIWGPHLAHYVYFEFGDRSPIEVDESIVDGVIRARTHWEMGRPEPGLSARVLDLKSGESEALSHAEFRAEVDRRDMLSPVLCADLYRDKCILLFDERVVWEGDIVAAHLIELDEPLDVRGVVLRERVQLATPAHQPAPVEMVGPLVAYSLEGVESGTDAAGGRRWHRREQVMVHDTGSGRDWRVFEWRVEFVTGWEFLPRAWWRVGLGGFGEWRTLPLWNARGGFVVVEEGTVRYLAPDGKVRAVLLQDALTERERFTQVVVSPDGRRVAIVRERDEAPDDYLHNREIRWPTSETVFVFDLPSGRMRARHEPDRVPKLSWHNLVWSDDGQSLLGSTKYSYIRFTVSTGEIEYVEPSEVRASRPQREPGALVECPVEQPCRVLLDGKVIGEGRWASIIGFTELD